MWSSFQFLLRWQTVTNMKKGWKTKFLEKQTTTTTTKTKVITRRRALKKFSKVGYFAKTAHTYKFRFSNVTYRPTIYKSGLFMAFNFHIPSNYITYVLYAQSIYIHFLFKTVLSDIQIFYSKRNLLSKWTLSSKLY